MERKRSVYIILISLLAIFWSGVRLFQNIHIISYGISRFSQIAGQVGLFSAIFYSSYYPLFSICLLVGGIAFLFLKRWGKILLQVGLAADILVRLYAIITAMPLIFTIARMKKMSAIYFLISGLEILFIDIIILCLIALPKTREQFKKQ